MPLPYEVTAELEIPASLFNRHAIAVVVVQGVRAGGDWHVNVSTLADRNVRGGFATSHPQSTSLAAEVWYPRLGHETAFIWLNDQVKQRGWSLLQYIKIEYAPSERPYFFAAQVAVGSELFLPALGVMYAGELTLDQVMQD
jgi:hypothetical protein